MQSTNHNNWICSTYKHAACPFSSGSALQLWRTTLCFVNSYLNPCIIRGLIAVLKMGAEKEASWAAFADAETKADSCVFIRLCSLSKGLHNRQNKSEWISGGNKVHSINDSKRTMCFNWVILVQCLGKTSSLVSDILSQVILNLSLHLITSHIKHYQWWPMPKLYLHFK